MKIKIILVLILTLVSGVLFYLLNMATPEPGMSSGNGNLAVLFLIILFPIGIILIYLWYSLLQSIVIPKSIHIATLFVIILYWIFGVFYNKSLLKSYRESLRDGFSRKQPTVEDEFIEHISSSLLSMYSNKVYFNLNTFIMSFVLILFISILCYLLKSIIVNKT